jgi:hypothetical protein
MSRCDLPVPESPIRQSGRPLLDPFAGSEGVDDGRVDVGVGVEVEGAQRLLSWERGGFDPAVGAATGAVVAFGHKQLGEKPAVGHLLPGRGVGDLGELRANSR